MARYLRVGVVYKNDARFVYNGIEIIQNMNVVYKNDDFEIVQNISVVNKNECVICVQ